MPNDLEMIERLHAQDIAASRTRDLTILLALCTDDCVMLPPDRPPVIGKAAIAKWLEAEHELEQTYEITKYEHHFQEIKILGEWAFEWGTFSASAREYGSDNEVFTSGKLFRILQKQANGMWKVARSIWSNDQ